MVSRWRDTDADQAFTPTERELRACLNEISRLLYVDTVIIKRLWKCVEMLDAQVKELEAELAKVDVERLPELEVVAEKVKLPPRDPSYTGLPGLSR